MAEKNKKTKTNTEEETKMSQEVIEEKIILECLGQDEEGHYYCTRCDPDKKINKKH